MESKMISRISAHITDCTDPWRNLAAEEWLTLSCKPGECILFLWQNARTVVIGRNQNCWRECRVAELEAAGGKLARRLSGGGAVFHDLGNLNFSFCMAGEDADTAREMEVVVRAAASFGLDAALTGRNDAAVAGRKFSGNAFYDERGKHCHHGTILISADTSEMARFLSPSKAKLESKGVQSVRSRVANLASLCPEITVEKMEQALIDAFASVYGLKPEIFGGERFDTGELDALTEKFSSWKWRCGRKIPFTLRLEERFSWSEVQVAVKADCGRVEEAEITTDCMEAGWFAGAGSALAGLPFEAGTLAAAAAGALAARGAPEGVCRDVARLIRNGL